MERLEAVLGRAFPEHVPSRDRLGKSFDRDRTEIAILEDSAEQAFCAGTDHHRTWISDALEPGRKVRGLPDDGLLLGGARSDDVTNDH